jgi:phosphosulfolactate synthase
VGDLAAFLDLPDRTCKPRRRGLTHVLDKGMSIDHVEGLVAQAGDLMDVAKVGWGIAYLDRQLALRIEVYRSAGILVCLGGTLLEIAVQQGRFDELRRWAQRCGIDAVEVSNGLGGMTPRTKRGLVRALAADFTVLAEAGSKDASTPVVSAMWLAEMEDDLAAGARWVIAEGRESGTVGLYRSDGTVREELVDAIASRICVERIIFETPQKSQQAWFIRRFGPDVNLGNVPPDEVLPLETLRVGLRADTADLAMPASRLTADALG